MPRLSELQDKYELKQEIMKAYKVIVPMILAGFIMVYFIRFFIIKVLFTAEFEPMQNLFIWQSVGSFFKITSWLLVFLMLAKSRTVAFISTEILFSNNDNSFSRYTVRKNSTLTPIKNERRNATNEHLYY